MVTCPASGTMTRRLLNRGHRKDFSFGVRSGAEISRCSSAGNPLCSPRRSEEGRCVRARPRPGGDARGRLHLLGLRQVPRTARGNACIQADRAGGGFAAARRSDCSARGEGHCRHSNLLMRSGDVRSSRRRQTVASALPDRDRGHAELAGTREGHCRSGEATGARLALNRAPRQDTESTPSLVISASVVPNERT
jgi:hypothetical protein